MDVTGESLESAAQVGLEKSTGNGYNSQQVSPTKDTSLSMSIELERSKHVMDGDKDVVESRGDDESVLPIHTEQVEEGPSQEEEYDYGADEDDNGEWQGDDDGEWQGDDDGEWQGDDNEEWQGDDNEEWQGDNNEQWQEDDHNYYDETIYHDALAPEQAATTNNNDP